MQNRGPISRRKDLSAARAKVARILAQPFRRCDTGHPAGREEVATFLAAEDSRYSFPIFFPSLADLILASVTRSSNGTPRASSFFRLSPEIRSADEIRSRLDKKRGYFSSVFFSSPPRSVQKLRVDVRHRRASGESLREGRRVSQRPVRRAEKRNRGSPGLAVNRHGAGYKMCYDQL